MSNLFAVLSNAASSMQAHQSRTATASHNISNADTPGYSRQMANLEATSPADWLGGSFVGRGVSLLDTTRARDGFVEAQMPRVLGDAAKSSATSMALQGLSSLDPDGGAGLSGGLGTFYSALSQLTQNPSDLGSRQAFVAAALGAALAFNRAHDGVVSARSGIDAQLAAHAGHLTDLTHSMAELNRQVRVELASGGQPNDLLDARQKVQDELVTLTGAAVVPDASGNVSLMLTNGGGALVSGDQAATIGSLPDATNSGHVQLTLTPPGSSAARGLTLTQLGGTVGGQLAARDGALATAESALDTTAFEWANAVNAVHRAGFGLDGVGARDLFSVNALAPGAAGTLAVNAAVVADPRAVAASASSATLPGDGTNLFSLLQTQSLALPGGTNVFDAIAAAIASYGATTGSMRVASERDGAVKDQLDALRQSTSGVSVDEELVSLIQSQRAYEAVMKVVKTTDDMLSALLAMR